jgi:dGTPase
MAAATPLQPEGLQTYSDREVHLLAAYAMHSRDTAGRKHDEPEHAYRGPYQRDRDRILHSSAFRRLSGKTQVFTGDMGDYHRTRLTHTFEVASIARTISRALRLNEDLAEALALFHDVGHPPFGHAGEDALAECLATCGGFSHNRHALVLAEELETRYHLFPGLNLTREVLESQIARVDKQTVKQKPLLEAQVVDAADSITYDAHDTDDALKLGLLTLTEVAAIPLIGRMLDRVRKRFTRMSDDLLRIALVHELIDFQVSDVLQVCGQHFASHHYRNSSDARASDFTIGPSRELAEQKIELERFLYQRVYRHPQLLTVRAQAQERIRELFETLVRNPDRLPPTFAQRVGVIGVHRAVGEYIAGMTDRFCDQQFERLRSRHGGG